MPSSVIRIKLPFFNSKEFATIILIEFIAFAINHLFLQSHYQIKSAINWISLNITHKLPSFSIVTASQLSNSQKDIQDANLTFLMTNELQWFIDFLTLPLKCKMIHFCDFIPITIYLLTVYDFWQFHFRSYVQKKQNHHRFELVWLHC